MVESVVRRLGVNTCLIKIPLFIVFSKHMSCFISVSKVKFTSSRSVFRYSTAMTIFTVSSICFASNMSPTTARAFPPASLMLFATSLAFSVNPKMNKRTYISKSIKIVAILKKL